MKKILILLFSFLFSLIHILSASIYSPSVNFYKTPKSNLISGEGDTYFLQMNDALLSLDERDFLNKFEDFVKEKNISFTTYLPNDGIGYYIGSEDMHLNGFQEPEDEENFYFVNSSFFDSGIYNPDMETIFGGKIIPIYDELLQNYFYNNFFIYPFFQKPYIANYFTLYGNDNVKKDFVDFFKSYNLDLKYYSHVSNDRSFIELFSIDAFIYFHIGFLVLMNFFFGFVLSKKNLAEKKLMIKASVVSIIIFQGIYYILSKKSLYYSAFSILAIVLEIVSLVLMYLFLVKKRNGADYNEKR